MPLGHPLAARQSVTFQDLDGLSLLAHRNALAWMELCRRKLPHSNLLAQDSLESLHQLIDSSTLPAFGSVRALERERPRENRVAVPLQDAEARATYYLACLQGEQKRYSGLFRRVRGGIWVSPVAGALVPNAGSVAVILNSAFLLQRRRKLPLEEERQPTLLS